MSEEKEPNKGIDIPEPSDPATELAESNGWMPEADWEETGKDPALWVSAREFNFRGELMGKIQGMGRKLTSLETENGKLMKAQQVQIKQQRDMVERQVEKALSDIKQQRRQAIEEGDYDTLDTLDDRRDELKAKKAELDKADEVVEETTTGPQVDISTMHPIERAFFDIVQTTPELRDSTAKAQELGVYADQIWGANPEISTTEFVRKLDQHLSPKREPAPKGPGRTGDRKTTGKSSKYTVKDLDDMERNMAETFKATGAYESVQEYIDIMAKNGDLSVQQR